MLCQISTKSLQHQETTKERQQNSVDLLTISMEKLFFVIAVCIKSFIVLGERYKAIDTAPLLYFYCFILVEHKKMKNILV